MPADPLEQRCTALSAGSVRWLEAEGLWSALEADACPIRHVHVSHRGRFGATRLSAAEQGVDALGQVIENRRVLVALDARLAASEVRRIGGVSVGGVAPDADGVTLHCTSAIAPAEKVETHAVADAVGARALRARLVIGVDGVDSRVRTALGVGVRRIDYRQSAVLGTLALERDHGNVAHERFTDSGPFALLPRPGRHVSLVECVSPERGRELAALDDTAFLAHLQARFGYRLGRFVASGSRSVVPLARVEATRQVVPRGVLLGNAVRLLHPVAGQGYNLALRDVAALVETLSSPPESARDRVGGHAAGVDDPGETRRLESFAASRRADQRRVIALTDALARGFRGENAALSHLRALALVGLDTVSPLRRRFARAAMGERG